jgi:hypothetical protein
MRFCAHIALVSMAAMSAGAAHAADWWLVSGKPGDRVAVFADAETLARRDDSASLRVLRIDRIGRSSEMLQQIRCSGVPSGEDDAVRRFACSSEQDRDQFGLILASQTPNQVARMIFAMGPDETPRPRS